MNSSDPRWMQAALRLAKRALGQTSPNPLVGAVLVRRGRVLGQGWHHRAGQPHAEIEALRDAATLGHDVRGATLYVTLEPCSTHGRTPPCSDAIVAAGIRRVCVGARDPNPRHAGRGLALLEAAGVEVTTGVLAARAEALNPAFAHWIVQQSPWVTVKSAMSWDGKIATTAGESQWITSPVSRQLGRRLRREADAILVGINTVLADDPELGPGVAWCTGPAATRKPWRRFVLDSQARTPLSARLLNDEGRHLTTLVVARTAPRNRVQQLQQRVPVWQAPVHQGRPSLPWLLQKMGAEAVTHLLVEGGGEVVASFLLEGLAHRVAFFYAPMIFGGRGATKAVGGRGVPNIAAGLALQHCRWRASGPDWFLTANVVAPLAAGAAGPRVI